MVVLGNRGAGNALAVPAGGVQERRLFPQRGHALWKRGQRDGDGDGEPVDAAELRASELPQAWHQAQLITYF